MSKILNRFRRDERGVTVIEYGVLAGLIIVLCIAAITTIGTGISGFFQTVANSV
jgi:pilus assembly protein Flp/PilA